MGENNMKKTIATFLCTIFLLMLSTAVTAVGFSDTSGTNCERAAEVLSALGIVEGKSGGIYDPDGNLTRAEMTAIVLRAMDVECGTENAIFKDVPTSHWASGIIAAAYQLGIINGTSETTFEPDKGVTYDQAVKMIVSALGYAVQAETMGGYPSGYLSKATQLDILKGVGTGTPMTRGDMAVLVYNALDVELFLKTSYGADTYHYTTERTKTLLSHYLKVTHYRGEVEAVPMARPEHVTARLLDDEVVIGGEVMKAGASDACDMLGIRSDIYVRYQEDDKPVVLAVVPCQGTKVVQLRSADISSSTSTSALVYSDADGKEVKADITGATLIWNGREETKTEARLTPEGGTVRLISGNGIHFDMVVVESFTSHVVESIHKEESIVYFKDAAMPMSIDFTDAELRTEMSDSGGMPITITDLAEWDVLSVAESDSRHTTRVRRMYRSREAVTGTVTECGDREVVIGDTAYPLAETMAFGTIEVGQDAAYYLDFTGAVVSVNTGYAGTGRTYGWLRSASLSKGVDKKLCLKIFTQEGEWKVFELKDKIDFNGVSVDSTGLIGNTATAPENLWAANVRPSLWANGAVVPQLLAYEVNEEGYITEIETASNKSDPKLDTDEKYGGEFSMDWYYNADLGEVAGNPTEFNGQPAGNTAKEVSTRVENVRGIFFGHIRTGNNTKFFIIPSDLTNEKGYSIRSLSSFGLDENRMADHVSFYDVDDSYFCGAMVMHGYFGNAESGLGDTYLDGSYPAALVVGKTTVLGDDGEILQTLKLYTSAGANMTVYYDDAFRVLYRAANANIEQDPAWYTVDAYDQRVPRTTEALSSRPKKMYIDPEDIQLGDVIQYETGNDGKLIRASMNFRAEYPGMVEVVDSGNANPSVELRNYYGGTVRMNGVVAKAMPEGHIIKVNLANAIGMPKTDESGNPVTALRMLQTSGKFAIWDKDTKTMRVATVKDITNGDEIFSYWKPATQVFTVIYR
ncbi:MAG: S-layer homology domain-containing protein [Ruminococcaceae bacterium]|nr:S-layer homology domain-containing protein [Oscillospiraceae bacterium]